ncbi:MAG: alpha/beta hydrolase [Pseudomonadota bacterium]
MPLSFLRSYAEKIDFDNPPIGGFVEVDGRRLHYFAEGPRDAPALVLIHGASGNLRDWTSSVLSDLAQSWRVIAFDRPGYGHSEMLEHDSWMISAQVHALDRAMAALGVDRFAVLGHSYGVAVALDWALRFPDHVTGIIAMSGAMTSWKGALGWRYRLGGVPRIGALMGAAAPLIARPSLLKSELGSVFAPQKMPPDYIEAGGVRLALRPETFALNLRAMDLLHRQTFDMMCAIPNIACPTEVLQGRADEIVPFDDNAGPIASLTPQSHTVVLDEVGHMPHHAVPEEVLGAANRLRRRLD